MLYGKKCKHFFKVYEKEFDRHKLYKNYQIGRLFSTLDINLKICYNSIHNP